MQDDPCVSEQRGGGSGVHAGKWVKFQAFSSLKPWSSGLHLLQLISHLVCVVRALCQSHRLWKNNLTGFNLPPPHSPSSSHSFLPQLLCCFEADGTHFVWQQRPASFAS